MSIFKPRTEGLWFRFQTLFSAIIFLSLSLAFFIKSYTTSPMTCHQSSNSSSSEKFAGDLDSLCYVQGTYLVSHALDLTVGEEVISPGGGEAAGDVGGQKIFLNYYQWSGWMFLSFAIILIVVYCGWRFVERGQIDRLMKSVRKATDEDDDEQLKSLLMQPNYIGTYLLINYTIFEVLLMVIVILAIFFANHMLNGEFWSYGTMLAFEFLGIRRIKSTVRGRIFPNRAKCSIHDLNGYGKITQYNAICTLTNNYAYSILYFAAWFYFMLLLKIVITSLLVRILFYCNHRTKLHSIEPLFPKRFANITELTRNLRPSSAFLLYVVSNNMNTDQIEKMARLMVTGSRTSSRRNSNDHLEMNSKV